jgi:hypothetical protein
MTENDEETKALQYIRNLSNEILRKLASLAALAPEANGNIAHHLAEVCLSGTTVATQIVPQLLTVPTTDFEGLATLSHDLMTELQEIRDGIDAILPDITALMNRLNQ